VHHLGNYDLTDLAGIYTLGAQPGTVIRENVVHDAHPYFMYGHGIYLDEGSSDILIERNWVSRTCSALFMLHYGVNNTVRNNIFAWTQCGCLMYDTLRGPVNACAGPPPDSTPRPLLGARCLLCSLGVRASHPRSCLSTRPRVDAGVAQPVVRLRLRA
jgi:hypothetical protein